MVFRCDEQWSRGDEILRRTGKDGLYRRLRNRHLKKAENDRSLNYLDYRSFQWLDEPSPKHKPRHSSSRREARPRPPPLFRRKPMTKNTREIVISLLALGFIVFGIGYHVMRERLRHADLHLGISKKMQRPLAEACRMRMCSGETFGKRTRKGYNNFFDIFTVAYLSMNIIRIVVVCVELIQDCL